MITIRTYDFEINIDPNKEYAIYDEPYSADKSGNPIPLDSQEVKTGKYYEYGNIIIETERKKYTLTKVYESYHWIGVILDYIDSLKNTENIFIDMRGEPEFGNAFREFDYGELLVEKL